MSDLERKRALTAFLKRARGRTRPQDVGLSPGVRRRVTGLRRDEVAALVDISEGWYTRFETGKARLSLPTLDRVADALRLDRSERMHLLTLAFPEFAGLAAADTVELMHGMAAFIDEVQQLAEALVNCATSLEIGNEASRTLAALSRSESLGHMIGQNQTLERQIAAAIAAMSDLARRTQRIPA